MNGDAGTDAGPVKLASRKPGTARHAVTALWILLGVLVAASLPVYPFYNFYSVTDTPEGSLRKRCLIVHWAGQSIGSNGWLCSPLLTLRPTEGPRELSFEGVRRAEVLYVVGPEVSDQDAFQATTKSCLGCKFVKYNSFTSMRITNWKLPIGDGPSIYSPKPLALGRNDIESRGVLVYIHSPPFGIGYPDFSAPAISAVNDLGYFSRFPVAGHDDLNNGEADKYLRMATNGEWAAMVLPGRSLCPVPVIVYYNPKKNAIRMIKIVAINPYNIANVDLALPQCLSRTGLTVPVTAAPYKTHLPLIAWQNTWSD